MMNVARATKTWRGREDSRSECIRVFRASPSRAVDTHTRATTGDLEEVSEGADLKICAPGLSSVSSEITLLLPLGSRECQMTPYVCRRQCLVRASAGISAAAPIFCHLLFARAFTRLFF